MTIKGQNTQTSQQKGYNFGPPNLQEIVDFKSGIEGPWFGALLNTRLK